MNFSAQHWLPALWLCPLLFFFYRFIFTQRQQRLARWANKDALARLISPKALKNNWGKATASIAIVALGLLALARPQWGFTWQKVEHKGIDLVVMVDTSKSMLADDVRPNRLERAKRELADLISLLRGDRIAVVAFAGSSFTICPMTHDYGAAKLFLQDLSPDIIPQGGTNIADAIRHGLASFDKSAGKHKAMILITDGESHEGEVAEAIDEAKDANAHIFTVGIGTPEGSRIRITEKGKSYFLKDSQGNYALSRLDDALLKDIAIQTKGAFVLASSGSLGLEELFKEKISGIDPKTRKSEKKKRWHHRFQWPLLGMLLLLLGSFFMGQAQRVKGDSHHG